MKTEKKVKLKYLLLFFLLAQAGFPYFVGNAWLLIFTVITGTVFFSYGFTFNKHILKFIFAFIVLMILQVVFLGDFLIGPFFGILIRVLYAYMVIKVIGPNFMKYYVDILYFFTIIALFMYFMFAFIPGFYDFGTTIYKTMVWPNTLFPIEVRQNIIIYTNDYWLRGEFPRNAGPFWEPGAYGVFLTVAILFNTIISDSLINKKNIVFFIALITTFSLGAFSAFLVFLYAYLILIIKIKPSTIVLSVIVFSIAYYAYNSFDFLGKKMETRYIKAQNFDRNSTYADLNYQVGRNEQAILDMNGFIRSPLFGEGQFVKYEYGASASGVTAFLRKWGILGFLLVFGSMIKSFKRYVYFDKKNSKYAMVAVITLLAVALPQSLYGKPLFLGFSFMFLVFSQRELKAVFDNDIKDY